MQLRKTRLGYLLEKVKPIFDSMNPTNEEKVVEQGDRGVACRKKWLSNTVQHSTQRTGTSKGSVQILITGALKVPIWEKYEHKLNGRDEKEFYVELEPVRATLLL